MNYYGFAHPVRESGWPASTWPAPAGAACDQRLLGLARFGARAHSLRQPAGPVEPARQPRHAALPEPGRRRRGVAPAGMTLLLTTLARRASTTATSRPRRRRRPRLPALLRLGPQPTGTANCSSHYRALIALRRRSASNGGHGGYLALLAEGDAFAFARFTDAAAPARIRAWN